MLYPQMDPDEWKTFCEYSKSEEYKKVMAHFKVLQATMPGNYRLNPSGYRIVEPKWALEAQEFEAEGKLALFSKHQAHPHDWRFIRACPV